MRRLQSPSLCVFCVCSLLPLGLAVCSLCLCPPCIPVVMQVLVVVCRMSTRGRKKLRVLLEAVQLHVRPCSSQSEVWVGLSPVGSQWPETCLCHQHLSLKKTIGVCEKNKPEECTLGKSSLPILFQKEKNKANILGCFFVFFYSFLYVH